MNNELPVTKYPVTIQRIELLTVMIEADSQEEAEGKILEDNHDADGYIDFRSVLFSYDEQEDGMKMQSKEMIVDQHDNAYYLISRNPHISYRAL